MQNWIHLCIDMQRMFSEPTPWQVPWMAKVSDEVVELASRHADKTIFTRFIPPVSAQDLPGTWKAYYCKWEMMTRSKLAPDLLELVPELKRLVPPAAVFDKWCYSPWIDGRLHRALSQKNIETLVITGGETDVCVLSAILGAIDLGYRVLVPKDAVCSTADTTHDATLQLLGGRFSVQVEIVRTEELLSLLR